MQSGLFIAEHFHVSEDKVIVSKYSFIVVQEPENRHQKKQTSDNGEKSPFFLFFSLYKNV